MDYGRKRSRKYTFKIPQVEELGKLGKLVVNPQAFKEKYGKLLPLLNTNIVDGILPTLVQFYDPTYHCFTFPDYQLMPTLEEYSRLIGIPVYAQDPYSGLEKNPDDIIIAATTPLNVVDIRTHMVSRGGIHGLPSKFLFDQARYFVSIQDMSAFEEILALLIYGLFLFPNINDFVDINAIKIFLIGNPVPTLLADAYHSVHSRNLQRGGLITCCVPLLYEWFVSHLPKSSTFWNMRDGLYWSQKIMSLTHSDIEWCSPDNDETKIIFSCGSFPNIPLIGTKGGISYNPALARRQYGYPMKNIPSNIQLEGLFFKNIDDHGNMLKKEIVQAWRLVHSKGRRLLGKHLCISLDPYLQWVRVRAFKLRMPYQHQEPIPLREPIYLFSTDVEKLQAALNKVCQERNAWRNKYRIVNTENVEIHNILRRKDELLEVLDRQVTQSSLSHHIPPASWIIDQLTSENAQLKKQKKMLEREVGSSSKF